MRLVRCAGSRPATGYTSVVVAQPGTHDWPFALRAFIARNMLLGGWSLRLPVSTQRSCEALNGRLLTSVLTEMLSAATG